MGDNGGGKVVFIHVNEPGAQYCLGLVHVEVAVAAVCNLE